MEGCRPSILHIMALYKAILAYDGTGFAGFQRQVKERTVQGEVEAALRKIGWSGATIYGAGRTDAGVHAAGQVIAFEMDWAHTDSDLQNALNASLPQDVAVRALDEAPSGFHPRYDASARRYVYRLRFDPAPDPLQDRFAWRLWPALDAARLDECAEIISGQTDFAGFGKAPKPGGSTVRAVFTSRWNVEAQGAQYTIEGNAFLFRMVRRIVFAQIAVAQGRLAIETLTNTLSGDTTGMVQGLAPAKGLTLEKVSY